MAGGAVNNSSAGMCARVSVSSGPMCMNYGDVQHAVQPSHGTSDPHSPRIAACIAASHAENSPAGKFLTTQAPRSASESASHVADSDPAAAE